MYRRCSSAVFSAALYHGNILSASVCCSSQVPGGENLNISSENTKNNSQTKPRRRIPRRVLPSDEDMADLHTVEIEAAASCEKSALSNVTIEPMRFVNTFSNEDNISRGKDMDEFRDMMDEEGDDDDDDNIEEGVEEIIHKRKEQENSNTHNNNNNNNNNNNTNIIQDNNNDNLLEKKHQTSLSSVDPLLYSERINKREEITGEEENYFDKSSIYERQASARLLQPKELVEMLVLYLRATENKRLVSAEEEHILFPVIIDRLNELHINQMLDIVECHWARSTLVRYGIIFKDMVRDRIALIASVAAKGATQKPKIGIESDTIEKDNEDIDNIKNSDNNNDNDDDAVYTHEVEKKSDDPILLNATEEMNADCVLRCIIVMGMSAGRRKRDLQFFQAMGIFLVHHINRYKDPHDLVRVLTAFARAKIIPPKGFLALLGRRFAVLNKRKPLGALPSYRAFVNLYKMGHDQMNSFRFLANCIFETIDTNVKAEKKRLRLAELQRNSSDNIKNDESENSNEEFKSNNKKEKEEKKISNIIITGDLDPQLIQVVKSRERFKRITELKPSMFTKLLLVLARFGAPHQQYLRPTINPLILPTLQSFPPPSFSRLLRAIRLFRTTDLELIEPIIDYISDNLGPNNVIPNDVLEVIRLISPLDNPVPRNLAKLINLCESVYSGKSIEVTRPIRPNDMCAVASVLLHIQLKDDVPLDALDPLTRLMELFAERMNSLMKLHIISLTHIDIFLDLCQQQQHPDFSGHIAQLKKSRHQLNNEQTDDEYYSHLDIDVRETFHKIMAINDFNTYKQYRPTPGILQVDFKQALTEVSAFDVLEASYLFAKAFPKALQPTVGRHLSRSLLAKLSTGEEVVVERDNNNNNIHINNSEGNRRIIILRPPRDLLLTREDLIKFVYLVENTPLHQVRESPVVWKFVEEKARKLKMEDILKTAQEKQQQQQVVVGQ